MAIHGHGIYDAGALAVAENTRRPVEASKGFCYGAGLVRVQPAQPTGMARERFQIVFILKHILETWRVGSIHALARPRVPANQVEAPRGGAVRMRPGSCAAARWCPPYTSAMLA